MIFEFPNDPVSSECLKLTCAYKAYLLYQNQPLDNKHPKHPNTIA